MGCNCLIFLPPRVRISDVGRAVAILAGLQPTRRENYTAIDVPVNIYGYQNRPDKASISFALKDQIYHVDYDFEPDEPVPCRMLSPKSTAFWIAIGVGLIRFFGGWIMYTGWDDGVVQWRVDVGTVGKDVAPTDGDAWEEFEEKLFNLKPMNPDDFESVAGYKTKEL